MKNKKTLKIEITAEGYLKNNKGNRLPTPKESKDFTKNLTPEQKEFKYIPFVEYPMNNTSSSKISYYTWWESIIRKVFKMGFFEDTFK